MSDESLLREIVEQNDDKHERAHKRLREALTDLADKVERNFEHFTTEQHAAKGRLTMLERAPVDAAKLVITPKVVMAIVVTVLSIAGSIWASTGGLRSDVRDILTRMEAQTEAYKANAKLQELQSGALKTAVDDMKRRQELQQYEIQQLKEVILGRK